MATLLRDPRIDNYDILAIQEPWKNPFSDTTHHPAKASWGGKGYTKRTLQRLERLQARAARVMSGAFKATSSPALDIEMHLLPIEQQIRKHNLLSIGRIGGTASPQPSSTPHRRKEKISPRETIKQELQQRPSPDGRQHEKIEPFVVPPWWQGPQVYIEDDMETAQEEHRRQQRRETGAIHVYTDGSGINGRIGAAAVCTTTGETETAYMGADTTSTVYAGELQGIILALQVAQADRTRGNNRSKLLIYTDNQAAIRSSARPKGKTGAYLLRDIAQRIQELNSQGLPTEIRWIPAHTGIQGNEDADIAAKEATGWRENGQTGPTADLPGELYSLQSTLKTWAHKEASRAWQTKWTSETRGRTSFRYTPKPTKKILQLHDGLIKRQSAILVQMRTEKIGLKKFLFNRRVPDITDDNCPCREGRQTVSHVLLRCRRFRQLRRQELGAIPGRHDLRALLNKRQAAAKAIRFMEQTEILGQFRIESQPRQS